MHLKTELAHLRHCGYRSEKKQQLFASCATKALRHALVSGQYETYFRIFTYFERVR